MDKIPCCHCGDVFERSVRHKNQLYCMRSECRRAKKARWQRQKMATDPEYRANQKTSHQKWLQANPSYWRQYRQRNPDKTERNRILQAIRNRRRTGVHAKMDSSLIAKMDASIINHFDTVGQFWMVPVIAKMDALKVNIYKITVPYR